MCWCYVFSFDSTITNPYSQQIYIIQIARNMINTGKTKPSWLWVGARINHFSYAHLNRTLTHKGLWLHLMTDQQRLLASGRKRNANHLLVWDFFYLHNSLSYQSSSELNTYFSYLAQYATCEHMIIKSHLLSSEILQDNPFFAILSKN